jgi:hypothetical protein
MLLRIQNPGGIAPRVNPRSLADNKAQTATNLRHGGADWQSWFQDLQVVVLPKVGTKQAIYRMGSSALESEYWLHWITDVDVARGAIAGNANEPTYYTGDSEPRKTDLTLALSGGGGAYPNNYRTLGLPKPASALTAAASGAVVGTATAEDRYYVYTLISSDGEESAPCAISNKVTVQSGQIVTLTGFDVLLTGSYNVVSKRIYVNVPGSNTTDYFFVAEITLATTSYVHPYGIAVGGVLTTVGYAQPPADMKGLFNIPNGLMGGFRNNELYVCEPYLPYAWPVRNMRTFPYDIVGCAVWGQNILVATKAKPWIVTGISPTSMTQQEADIMEPCLSKRSVKSVETGVCYVSRRGLIFVGQGGPRNVTESIFNDDDWAAMKPESVMGVYFQGKYFGFYDTGTVQAGWVMDFQTNEFTMLNFYATAAHVDPRSGYLYLQIGNNLVRFQGSASRRTWTWKSKKYELPNPLNINCARVVADSYPVQFTVYGDGVQRFTKAIPDNKLFRLPAGYQSYTYEVEMTTAARVQYVEISDNPLELGAA